MKIKFLFTSLLALSLVLPSCKEISLISKFDANVLSEVKMGQQLTKKLYDEAVANPDKSYSVNSENYDLVSAQISSLKDKEAARAKSALLLEQVKTLETAFSKAKADHKKKGALMDDANLLKYKDVLNRQWESIINAEESLPKEKKN